MREERKKRRKRAVGMKRRRKKEKKKEKKKQKSRCEEKKKEKKKKLVIRQDTKQWVPFVAKNYGKCHLTLFSIFRNSQIVFLILVSHHSKTKELGDGNIAK